MLAVEEARTGPGRVTVVEFVDYRCSFCRQQADVLAEVLARQAGVVRFVVKHVPLDKHPGARRAARAAVCAEAQGKLPAMHDALLRAPDTSDATMEELAQAAGVDLTSYQACTRAPSTDDRIQDDLDAFESVGADGLPLLFIGRRKFVGLTDVDDLEAALRDELDRVR